MKPFVYITRKLPDEVIQPLTKRYDVEMWDQEDVPVPREILVEKARTAAGLLTVLSDKIDQQVLDGAASLKVIANLAVGFDNIDIPVATSRNVAVCNTPDVLTDTTADLTFGLLMATARRIVEADQYVRKGQWKSWSPLLLAGADIHHKTIGIVGMGSIGEAVARRAKGFDMEVLYHNRTRKMKAENEIGAIYTSFEELLTQSDFIVCLAPLTSETREMFGSEQFQQMKKSAIFVNAARGPIVNEQALFDALKEGQITAAGLDVFENEPIDETHPLLTLPNVVALPHIGSSSVETRSIMMKLCVDNIANVLEGEDPVTIVNKEWNKNVCKH